jgi:hypothetical protein
MQIDQQESYNWEKIYPNYHEELYTGWKWVLYVEHTDSSNCPLFQAWDNYEKINDSESWPVKGKTATTLEISGIKIWVPVAYMKTSPLKVAADTVYPPAHQ